MIAPGTSPERFTLREPFRSKLQDTPPVWGHQGLSEVTFYRTYSRRKPDGTMETWQDCVIRVIEGMWTIIKTHARMTNIPWHEKKAQKLAEEAALRMHCFKWTPAGRGMWMMGTDYIWERGSAALQNCAFVSTEGFDPDDPDETVAPFTFLMDVAMLGCGPGFDTLGAGKVGVRGFQGAPVVHRIADSREGWVEVVRLTLRNIIFGGPDIIPDPQDVRGPNLPLKSFGGTSCGPVPLLQGLEGLKHRYMMKLGQDVDSVLITDTNNIIGKLVVAGNIRRTAEIGFGRPGDMAFAGMKDWSNFPVETGNAPPRELLLECPEDYQLYADNIFKTANGIAPAIAAKYADRPWAYQFGGWRWASNNSMLEEVGADYAKYNDSIVSSGEPGFGWLDLMRRFGRMKDPENNKDYRVKGGNPCLEQSLESYELCNLVENYPSHADDYWDFQRSMKFSYLYAKAVTLMGTHIPRTNEVMSRNRRIGCSLNGVADTVAKIGRHEFLTRWCEDGYRYVQYLDKKYSEWLGVRESIKTTSEKPSGTVTLLSGTRGAGAHFPQPTGYRTMRIATDSNVVPLLRAAGYMIEPAISDPTGTLVVYFPWLVDEDIPTVDDVGLWEQVKIAADLQYWWADNQVSYTATFTKEEGERGEIGRVLTAFDGQLKGISFLAKTHGYAQAPYIKADRQEVLDYAAALSPIDWSSFHRKDADFDANVAGENAPKFCEGEYCAV